MMRTTITLDDDVYVEIEAARQRTGAGFKDIVNQALRAGLRTLRDPKPAVEPYRTPSTSLGGCRLPDLDDVAGALAIAEGEGFR